MLRQLLGSRYPQLGILSKLPTPVFRSRHQVTRSSWNSISSESMLVSMDFAFRLDLTS